MLKAYQIVNFESDGHGRDGVFIATYVGPMDPPFASLKEEYLKTIAKDLSPDLTGFLQFLKAKGWEEAGDLFCESDLYER